MIRSELAKDICRQGGEVLAIVLLALAVAWVHGSGWLGGHATCLLVLALALAKTIFFFVENLTHILLATRDNMPYHKVLGLMGGEHGADHAVLCARLLAAGDGGRGELQQHQRGLEPPGADL